MTHSGERESLPRFAELDADYEIVKELGRGGTAVVYLAHERMLNREVAIKVIRSTYMEDPEAVGRLMREARTVGRMQHPNIVVLYGTRRLGDGSLALIMQYVPGRTLRREIQDVGGLPFDRVHRILTDLCRALAYAHRQLIVHRDIKPENIYLDDDSGIARLSDFGIARSWAAESDLTIPGTAIGTPAYMSPEQIDGSDVDGRSDLYSLGLVGYEMLTGTRLWAGESLYAMIAKQKNEQLPSLAEQRPGIPPSLQAAIEGALRKDPKDRWQTAGEFLAALGSAPDPERVEPRSPFAELIAIETPEPFAAPAPATSAVTASPQSNETVVWRPPADDLPADEPVWEPSAEPAVEPDHPRRRGRRYRRIAVVVAAVLLIAATATVALVLLLRRGPAEPRVAANGRAAGPAPMPATPPPQLAPEPVSHAASDTNVTAAAATPEATSDTPAAAPDNRPALAYVVFGDGQRGPAGSVLPKPLMVRVVDATGRAVAGATVRFNVTAGDGAVQPTMGVTNQDGVVAARWLPRTVGVHRAQARIDGLVAAPIAFRAQALPGAAASRTAPGGARSEPVRSFSNAQRDPMPFALDQRGTALIGTTAAPLAVRRAVVAGGRHTCSLGGDGIVVCWGAADAGQLGGRPAGGRGDAIRVAAEEPFARIAAGMTHSCAITVTGVAFCWGGNASGQLGDGTLVNRALPSRVRLTDRLLAVTVGLGHSCALDATGRISCWGQNHRGQLGDRTTSDRSLAVRVAGRRSFRSVVAGWTHTCALTPEGAAYCWGSNRYGELGNGSHADRAEPVAVAGGHRFTALAAGHRFTCGLREDGAVLCWGENSRGQLGNGSTAHASEPLEVLAANRFTDIAAGGAHACAISWDGPAYCWGDNAHGQLGDGTVQPRLSPTALAGGHRFGAITASIAHTCGMTASGRSFCWGSNREGQLGAGPRSVQTRAAAVTPPGDGG